MSWLAKRIAGHLLGEYHLPKDALTWLAEIFLGLEHLHLVLGTLQRDLKPRNVVFSRTNRAKLTDFGMGRIGLEHLSNIYIYMNNENSLNSDHKNDL